MASQLWLCFVCHRDRLATQSPGVLQLVAKDLITWSRGVTVSTLDSESSDRGSNPREASFPALLLYSSFLILLVLLSKLSSDVLFFVVCRSLLSCLVSVSLVPPALAVSLAFSVSVSLRPEKTFRFE